VPSKVPSPQTLAPLGFSALPRAELVRRRAMRTPPRRRSGSVAAKQKLTVPVGFPVGAGETAAVNVTDAPTPAGFGEPVSAVEVVVAALIVSVSVPEVDVAKPELPEYAAVISCMPDVRLLVMKTAIPDASTFTVPSKVAPSEKSTVPSAEPVGAGVTAAVKVTAAPTVAGFGDAVSVVAVATNWPVPERFTIGSHTPTDPVREPGCVGVKTTVIRQLSPGLSTLEPLQVVAEPKLKSPLI